MSTKFCELLLKWDQKGNDRPMPWKGEKDPYKIWLSEIILQQTRVEQGWAYYERFVKKYPNIHLLAKAKDQAVFKLWEGLGYYNRCKNLLFTARQIVADFNGKFPNTYENLLQLKGVGPYTAAAIASFAYNLPHAVVDGNVFRVFARYYGINTPTDSKEGIDLFNKIAFENLAKNKAGIYNQALMDFGATVCKPATPLCSSCVMKKGCAAFLQNTVGQLPIKLKVIQKKKRSFDYFFFIVGNTFYIQQRQPGDIWAGLYQPYLLEQERLMPSSENEVRAMLKSHLSIDVPILNIELNAHLYQQQLTHQLLTVRFTTIYLQSVPSILSQGKWIKLTQRSKYPFPKTIKDYLEKEATFV